MGTLMRYISDNHEIELNIARGGADVGGSTQTRMDPATGQVLKDSFTSLLQTLVLQMPVTGLYEGKTFAQDFQATQKVFGSLKTLFGLFLVSAHHHNDDVSGVRVVVAYGPINQQRAAENELLTRCMEILQHAKPLSQIPLVGLLFIPPVNLIAVGKVAVRAATNPVFPPDVIDVHEILRCSQQRTEISLRSSLREDVQWLRNELLFMQSFLKDAEEMQSGDERVQQWVFEINSAANDAVAILETYNFEAGEGEGVGDGFATRLKACACICRKETKLYKVGKEIQSLEQQIMDISRK
ncbi:hypothetical protein T459_01287 [Capsicum annuum]|uniref:Disease resistance N-terminal domain-containing protein n=1 Tax=Capsicum annuum TaxID=4072 RepID=A0A2G3AGN4_CAPAN|nr:hypothetical protein T459_01287 [Capsicum annuum]